MKKAARDGKVEVLQALVASGEHDLNEQHDKGCTALWWACDRGRLEAARVLIRASADVNLADDSGTTPLIAASFHGRTPIVELLLRSGAQIMRKDATGTALEAARSQGHRDVGDLLEGLMTSEQLASLPPSAIDVGDEVDAHKDLLAAAEEARHAAEVDRLEAELARAELHEREHALASREQRFRASQERLQVAVPAYWKNHAAPPDGFWSELVDVTASLADSMQQLFSRTCDSRFIGQGRDGHGLTHRLMRVVSVHRVENAKLWRAYAARRADLHTVRPGRRYAVSTDSAAPASWLRAQCLERAKGEVMLFTGAPSGQHGTPDIIRIIAEQGPDERVSAMSGMFGAGVYFAERCSKADAYAGPGQPGDRAKLFVARVALGTPHVTSTAMNGLRRPPTLSGQVDGAGAPPTAERRCDSVVFDGTGRNYKEFIIFDRCLCYPEYMIEYERVA